MCALNGVCVGKVDRKSVVCVGLLTTLSTRLFVIVSRPHAAAGADGDARHYQLDDVVNVMMREGRGNKGEYNVHERR